MRHCLGSCYIPNSWESACELAVYSMCLSFQNPTWDFIIWSRTSLFPKTWAGNVSRFHGRLPRFLGGIHVGWCHVVPSLQNERGGKKELQEATRGVRMKQKKPQRIFNLTRLSGASGSHEHCDITVVKNPFPESPYYMHARSLHILPHRSYPHSGRVPHSWSGTHAEGWMLLGQANLRGKIETKRWD